MNLKTDVLAFLGLSALAIAQPLLGTLGGGATFFVAHGAQAFDVLWFALTIYLLPTLVLIALTAGLKRINIRLGSVFAAIALGLLGALWMMSLVSSLASGAAIAVALVFALVIAWIYLRQSGFADLLKYLGMLSPLVLLYFLFLSPVSSLLLPPQEQGANRVAGHKTPIVFLLFDELSQAAISAAEGNVDAARMPNFARLAQLSTWYYNTTTVSTQTEKAVPAILSGMRPGPDSQPTYSDYPRNLFTLLQASHSISAKETFTRLCPESACPRYWKANRRSLDPVAIFSDAAAIWLHAILPAELAAQHLPSISSSWRDFWQETRESSAAARAVLMRALMLDTGRDQQQRFTRFLSHINESEGPRLIYLHLVIPHIPWIYLPDGTLYNGREAPGQSTLAYDWLEDQYLVDQGALRYALQVEYTDRLLGQVLDALQASGRFDETLLIIASDHGLAFAPGELRRTPVDLTLADAARVPLFIKYPGQMSGQRDERPVETIDILPTIAAVLGLPLSGEMDGQSLIAPGWQPATRAVLEAGDGIADFESMDMAAAIARLLRVREPGRSALDSMGLGELGHLVGGPVPADVVLSAGPTLQLNNSKWYTDVSLDNGFLPARLTATLEGAAPGTALVVALNNTFAGSGRSHDQAGQVSIMLDPRRFVAGDNRLRAFIRSGAALQEISIVGDYAAWEATLGADGKLAVAAFDGARWQQASSLTGRAAFAASSEKVVSLSGYACDEVNLLAPHTILLLRGEEILTSSFALQQQPFMVPARPGTEKLMCWFSIDVQGELRREIEALRIVALFEDGRMAAIAPVDPIAENEP